MIEVAAILFVGAVLLMHSNRNRALIEGRLDGVEETIGRTKTTLSKKITKQDQQKPKNVDFSQVVEDVQAQAWTGVVIANNMMEMQIIKYILEERYGAGSVCIEDEYIRNDRGGFDLKSYQLSVRS